MAGRPSSLAHQHWRPRRRPRLPVLPVLLLLLLLLAPREHHIVRLPVQALLRAGGRLLALLGLTRAVAPRLGLGTLLALLLPQHLVLVKK